jgi:RNA polymerase sigma factor (sigma-70 family)
MNEPDGLATVIHERRQLLNLAYRLLGSVADAEDAVQETYARWYAMPPARQAEIASIGAWLTTVASRVCLDQLGSARARRERYVGEWIPEPVPDAREWPTARTPVDPADRVTLDESVSMAFLVVLDAMTPAERVVFVLHDVFRYPFAEVARMVGRSPEACRKLASSARRRIRDERSATAPARADLLRDFKSAWEARDIAALVELLDPNASMRADGGGLVGAALRPVEGAEAIARYMVDLARLAPEMEILERTVNGQPGLVACRDGVAVAVAAFDTSEDRIARIWVVRNPDKLRRWRG